jgi:hypothetical protein
VLDHAGGVLERDAELRARVRGADRFVRRRVDAGRESHEHPADARLGCALGLGRRVEDDGRRGGRGGSELLVRLVVAVEDEPFPHDACRLGERELAERRDVGADALVGEHAQQLDVRERLRPVHDERAARLGPDRLLAVDDERGAVGGGELGRGDAAERELAAVDARGIGEELEHGLASIRLR